MEIVVFTGPAGCGKTTLSASYGEWLAENMGLAVGYVNLDPGVKRIPYKPDIDVRRIVTVESVMKDYGLGPNGAFLKAADIIVEKN